MAKKYIDADSLINYLYDYQDCEIDIPKEIAEFQSADVVEVVRCKDCKHFAIINQPYNETFCKLCFMNKSEMGYCDKAERRNDE